MMVRVDLLQQLGRFDSIFDPFGPEDLDFSLRLQALGYTVAGQPWHGDRILPRVVRGPACEGGLGWGRGAGPDPHPRPLSRKRERGEFATFTLTFMTRGGRGTPDDER